LQLQKTEIAEITLKATQGHRQ